MTALFVYFAFLKTAFIRQSQFRLTNVSGIFTNTFFMLFRAAVFQALFQQTDLISGYTLMHTLTYIVMVQVLISAIPLWGFIGVSEDIRSGQIAMDLLRPFNYYGMILFKSLGRSIFFLFARGMPALCIGVLLGFFQIIPDFYHILLGCMSILLGAWLINSIHFLIELTGFWLESPQGPKRLSIAVTFFLSGSVIPIALFPPWAKAINAWLPFEYAFNAPIEIILGTTDPIRMLGLQCLWVLIISALCLIGLHRGEQKVTLHGG